jgi:CheY-like chemotaxis protein/AraC-like DNA-binding protein
MGATSGGGRVRPTVGDGDTAVNVQGCRISVGDCESLWQALAVQEPKHLPDRPVVLVVDDDDGVREALHLVLDAEFDVVVATHGRAALGAIRAQRVDLVLLDILMPDVDGLEVLQEIKAVAPDLPVIMMTAVKTVRTTVAAMKLGAADYLTKPFQEDELLAAIRRAIGERTARPAAPAEREPSRRDGPSARAHRLLLVGGDPGWRATLAVTLARAVSVETTGTLVDGLNVMLRFRPTCVVLNVGRAPGEAPRFLGALNAQLPACPVLVVSEDPYLGAEPVWENLNIRAVLRPPVSSGDLVRRIGAVLPPGSSLTGPWPQLGESVTRAIDYLSRHFEEDLTVDAIAEVIEISSSHLAHVFRAETGLSVRDYLTRVRVTIVQDLLASTDEKLESVAARVGFGDTSHLAHVFQRITGRPPSAYRRGYSAV